MLAGAFSVAGVAHAQSYPSRPIKIIVSYPPGGGVDTVARMLGQRLQESMGQAVVIENRAGASEILGMSVLAKSPADGYTIALTGVTLSVNPMLFPKLPYDVERDFVTIGRVVTVPLMLVAHPSVPVNSIKELVELAKAQPGKLNYAHIGAGSPHFLGFEWFKSLAAVDIKAVPYKGVSPGTQAVTAGEVQFTFTGLSTGMPLVKAGKLKALAVASDRRVRSAPDVPTMAESGYSGFTIPSWYGMIAPAGTPAGIIAILNREIVKAVQAPDLQQRFAEMGVEAAPSTPEELAQSIRNEMELFGRIIKLTGAKPDQ